MTECKMQLIVPHRSYRKLRIHKGILFLEIFLYAVISFLAVYLYTTYLLDSFVYYFHEVLGGAGITSTITAIDIFGWKVELIDLSFAHTQPLILLFGLIGLVLFFLLLIKQKIIPLNVVMWINFYNLLFISFILYFIFFAKYFPYTFIEFFELFTTAHIGFMLFSFILTSAAISLTPATLIYKLLAYAAMVIYYLLFSLVRYGLSILLVSQVSIVWAPIVFFTFYLDFFFFVALYSYFLYRSSLTFQRKDTVWIW